MKAKILSLVFLGLCILVARLAFTAPQSPAAQQGAPDQQSSAGIVAKCFNGDSFQLQDRRVVRLAGIEAPKLGKEGKPPQFYARAAKEILKNLAMGHKVILSCPGVKRCDMHGRYVGEARLAEDDKSINEYMLQQGAAYYFSQQDLGPEFQERLLGLQNQAILERRGFWDYLLSLPLASEPYSGNRDTMRFFPASSPESQNIKPRNKVNFGSLMDAFMAGYAPANSSLFWPIESR